MTVREHMERGLALDAAWLRVVNPALGVVRLGLYAALAYGPAIGIPLNPSMRGFAAAVGAGQMLLQIFVAFGRVSPLALAYGTFADALVIGLIGAGSGVAPVVVGLGVAGALAVAYLAGGARLLLPAAMFAAVGWLVGALTPQATSADSPARLTRTFLLEAESTYHGHAASAPPIEAALALLAVFGLICVACAIALLRAGRARQRALQACAQADALEAIVDAHLVESEEQFWEVVLHHAGELAGARVYAAHADAGLIRLRSPHGASPGTDIEQTAEWVLQNLRIPLSTIANPLVRALTQGTEEQVEEIDALCAGSVRTLSSEAIDKLKASWRVAFFIAPCSGRQNAGLVVVVPKVSDSVRRELRAAAARLAVALRRRSLAASPAAAPLAMGGEV